MDLYNNIEYIDYKLEKYISKMNSIYIHDNMSEYEIEKMEHYLKKFNYYNQIGGVDPPPPAPTAPPASPKKKTLTKEELEKLEEQRRLSQLAMRERQKRKLDNAQKFLGKKISQSSQSQLSPDNVSNRQLKRMARNNTQLTSQQQERLNSFKDRQVVSKFIKGQYIGPLTKQQTQLQSTNNTNPQQLKQQRSEINNLIKSGNESKLSESQKQIYEKMKEERANQEKNRLKRQERRQSSLSSESSTDSKLRIPTRLPNTPLSNNQLKQYSKLTDDDLNKLPKDKQLTKEEMVRLNSMKQNRKTRLSASQSALKSALDSALKSPSALVTTTVTQTFSPQLREILQKPLTPQIYTDQENIIRGLSQQLRNNPQINTDSFTPEQINTDSFTPEQKQLYDYFQPTSPGNIQQFTLSPALIQLLQKINDGIQVNTSPRDILDIANRSLHDVKNNSALAAQLNQLGQPCNVLRFPLAGFGMRMAAKVMKLGNSANVAVNKCKEFNKTNTIEKLTIDKNDIMGVCKDKDKLLSYIPIVKTTHPEIKTLVDKVCGRPDEWKKLKYKFDPNVLPSTSTTSNLASPLDTGIPGNAVANAATLPRAAPASLANAVR
jgi:hypothetical protein